MVWSSTFFVSSSSRGLQEWLKPFKLIISRIYGKETYRFANVLD